MMRFMTSQDTQIGIAGTAVAVLALMTGIEFSRSGTTAEGQSESDHLLGVIAETFDVGEVPPGSGCPMTVELSNHSRLPVRILRIHPSCTCTDFQLEGERRKRAEDASGLHVDCSTFFICRRAALIDRFPIPSLRGLEGEA